MGAMTTARTARGGVSSSTALDSTWADGGTGEQADALRLRRALHTLKGQLSVTDGEVIELLTEWQELLDSCDTCRSEAARHRSEAEALEMEAEEHRTNAELCFQSVNSKLSSAAHAVHLQTAPFVTIEHQQALQLQSWLH